MFPLPLAIYGYVAAAVLSFGSLLYGHHEHAKLNEYKQEIAVQTQHQKDLVAEEKRNAQTITSNIVNGYSSYLNGLRHNNGSSGMRPISNTASGTNAAICTQEFVDAANETEVQLEYLQQWVDEQCKLGCSK